MIGFTKFANDDPLLAYILVDLVYVVGLGLVLQPGVQHAAWTELSTLQQYVLAGWILWIVATASIVLLVADPRDPVIQRVNS